MYWKWEGRSSELIGLFSSVLFLQLMGITSTSYVLRCAAVKYHYMLYFILLLLQGTAGFGIGKGANGAVAVKKALRAARRDLIFVDRYKVVYQTFPLIWICLIYIITH